MQPSQEPRGEGVPQTRQEAQLNLILRDYGDTIGRGPENWQETGVEYLFRAGYILVRTEYLDDVRRLLPRAASAEERRPEGAAAEGEESERPLVLGLRRLRLTDGLDTHDALRIIRDGRDRNGRAYGTGLGAGAAAPDHLVHISGNAGNCPASEPEVVPPGSAPDPGMCGDRAAGEGVKVVVVDTGLDPAAAGTHLWMSGVTGEPDPAIQSPTLLPYAGHGTFIAGVVRAMAPRAEVFVRAFFDRVGAIFESDLVMALDKVLDQDAPDIISMSAGTWTFDPTGLLSFTVFHENRLRHHKGVLLVVAAGNDADRKPFWPAAAPWTVSVGALAADWRSRASFSNFGGWVDVYAPGENLVNAYPTGTYAYHEPPYAPGTADFAGMASWSGTSFSTPVVAGLVAARMSRTGENGRDAAAALLAKARSQAIPGLGAVLLPE
jgi:subtilisin family serine protease